MLPGIVLAVHNFSSGAKIASARTCGENAVVAFSNARLEGAAVAGRLYLRRYDFGWQPVDMEPGAAGLPACGTRARDVGPRSDVAAVRRIMRDRMPSGQVIGPVHVVKGYALANWWGTGGGQTVLRKSGARWSVIANGGGEIGASDMARLGIPDAVISEILHERKRF